VLVGCAVSAGCLYLVTRTVSLAEVRRSLSAAHYPWLVPTLALTYLTVYLRAVRWRVLFADPAAISSWQCFGAVNIGLGFNNLLPSRAGEIPRMIAARRATGLSAFEVGATIVVERVLDAFVVALLGLGLAPWLPSRPWVHLLVLVCGATVAVFLVAVVALTLLRHPLSRLLLWAAGRLPLVSERRAREAVVALAAGSRVLARPRRLVQALVLSALVWGVAGASTLVLFPAFGLDWHSLAPWFVLVANTLALTVPSSPGTLGVYEASVQASLVACGVPASQALAFAIVLHAVNFFPVILSGAVASWLMTRRASGASRRP
jgi:glycosyltransferase 2 family protein